MESGSTRALGSQLAHSGLKAEGVSLAHNVSGGLWTLTAPVGAAVARASGRAVMASAALASLASHAVRVALPMLPQNFPGYDWWLLVALVVALLAAGAASAAETALTSVSHIKIRNLAEEGDATAQRIRRILEHPDVFLSTILIVSNVAVITASTLATIIAVSLNFTGAEVLSTVLLSLIVLIFCEITPKTAAVQAPERWARWLIGPVEGLAYVLRPLVIALTWLTSNILRLFGGKPQRRGPFVTEDELRLLVEVGEEEGVLEEEEREMIHNVFDLADTSAREIMVPRIDMVTAKINDTVEAATQLIIQGGQSRIPIYDEASADIVGVLYAKDLLRVLATQTPDQARPQTVRDLPLRQPYFVPESKRLDDLLHEMQRQQVHIAIVVDEYGGVAGLVTIEDLVEEIIGDIKDEYDTEEQLFEQVGPNEYIVDAKISLDEFNEQTEEELTSDEYDTLGGLVYAQLDKIPTAGDTVTYEDLTLTVLGTKGRRITKVKVVRATPGGQTPATPAPLSTPNTRRDDHDDHSGRDSRNDSHGSFTDGPAGSDGAVPRRDLSPTSAPISAPISAPLAPTGAGGAAIIALSAFAETAPPEAEQTTEAAEAAPLAPTASAALANIPPVVTLPATTNGATPQRNGNGHGASGARPANPSAPRSGVPQGRGQQNSGAQRRSPDRSNGGSRQPQRAQPGRASQSQSQSPPNRPQPPSQHPPQQAPVGAQASRSGAARPASGGAPNGRARQQAAVKPGRPPNVKTPSS